MWFKVHSEVNTNVRSGQLVIHSLFAFYPRQPAQLPVAFLRSDPPDLTFADVQSKKLNDVGVGILRFHISISSLWSKSFIMQAL